MNFLQKNIISTWRLKSPVHFIKIFLLICVISACNSNKQADSAEVKYFFDLKGYFDDQAKILNEKYKTPTKTVSVDGKAQKKELEKIDWEKELSVFSSADINKSSWQDKYRADTMATIDAVNILYTALDDKLKTRLINVKMNNKLVEFISIDQLSDNMIYNSKKTLTYSPSKGYTLENKQKARFLKEHLYEINVDFE